MLLIKKQEIVFNISSLALHFSVMNDHYELTRILCLYNIDLNRKDFNGQTPIFYAITYRAYKSLRVLVEYNSELNLQEYYL